ncbi:MAG: PTS sugar transporter subunit IIA [bacterium]|nr:PTS sugar transporter subunit IIA [bacterium]
MKLVDILKTENVKIPLKGKNKEEIIEELVDLIVESNQEIDHDAVHQAILDREKTMSTGIGQGVAIPHGKTEGVDELMGAFGIAPDGVDFDSLDNKPTYLFFLLVSPVGPAGPHLRCLSRISRLLNREDFRELLMKAGSPEEAVKLINDEEKKYFEIN